MDVEVNPYENETHQWEVSQTDEEEVDEKDEEIEFIKSQIKIIEKRQKNAEETLRWDLLQRLRKRDLYYCLCRFCILNCTLCCIVHSLTIALCLYVFIDSLVSKIGEIPKLETSTTFEELNNFNYPSLTLCSNYPELCNPHMDLNVSTGRGVPLPHFTFSQTDHLGKFWTCYSTNVLMDYNYQSMDVYLQLRLSVQVNDPPGKSCLYSPLILVLLNTTQFAEQAGFSSAKEMMSSVFSIGKFISYGIESFGSKGTLVSNNALNFLKYREVHHYSLEDDKWDSNYPIESKDITIDSFKCNSSKCEFISDIQLMRVNPTTFYVEFLELKWYTPIFAVGGVIGTFGILKIIVDCICGGSIVFGQKTFDNCIISRIFPSGFGKKKRKKKKRNRKREKKKKKDEQPESEEGIKDFEMEDYAEQSLDVEEKHEEEGEDEEEEEGSSEDDMFEGSTETSTTTEESFEDPN